MSAPNGCGRERLVKDASSDKEKEIYEVGMLTIAVTIFCHHYNEDGKHLVTNGLSSEHAKKW